MKKNSSYKYGCFHVGTPDMWGNYCPETGEYYLAHKDLDPVAGECIGVLASAYFVREGEWKEQSARGYSYQVVRQLLRLGHLTSKTLASFIEAGGEVWWDQPKEGEEK